VQARPLWVVHVDLAARQDKSNNPAHFCSKL
jgi:hypothetical protein